MASLWRWAERHPGRAVAYGIAASSAARLAYVAYLGDDLGGPDSNTYDQGGWELSRRGPGSDQVTGMPYFPPGYFFVVALHYRIAGRHPLAVKITQVALVALVSWLTFRVALRVAPGRAALIAGLGMSASLAWLALAHPLMYEPWLALCVVGALVLLLSADRDGSWRLAAGAGALLGAAAVLQDKFLTLVPVLALWLMLRHRRAALALALAAMAVVAPFAARNQVVYGQPIVLATNRGVNLLIGNNPTADGSFTNMVAEPPWCPGVNVFDTGDRLGTDRALTSCALRLAWDDPLRTVRLLPSKFARFWATFVGPWSGINNWRHKFDPRIPLPDTVTGTRWFRAADYSLSVAWVLGGLTLMALGVGAVARRSGRMAWLLSLPVAWLLAVHLATFGDPRFRIPVLPIVWLLQAAGIAWLAARLSRHGPAANEPVGPMHKEVGVAASDP